MFDLECDFRLATMLCTPEAAVASCGVNSRFALFLSEPSNALCTACRHIFVTLCRQSLKTCLSHGLSVVGVSCRVLRIFSWAAAMRSYTLESSSALSVCLFHRNRSMIRVRSVDWSDFENIGSKFSGYWSSASKILSLDFCKLLLRLMPFNKSMAFLLLIDVVVSVV